MNLACRLVGLGALFFFSVNVSAQGWFTGGAAGQAAQQEYEIGGPIDTVDDTDESYRIFGGYLISPIQGVVASYIDLGEPFYDGAAFGGFEDKLSADGFDISWIIGFTPGAQDRVSIFGTIGVFAWNQDVTYTDPTGTFEFKDEGTSFSYGVGSEFNFSRDGSSPWGIHLEYQLFKNIGDARNSGHEYDREVLSIGASYRFGGSFGDRD